MDSNMKRLMEHMTAVELAAQDLLEERQNLIELDKKRNQTREAKTALRNIAKSAKPAVPCGKTLICFGNTFIKFKTDVALEYLEETYKDLDNKISSTRSLLHSKLNAVREAEGKSRAAGFDLKSLSDDELKSVSVLLK